jgi:hypothetical protein
LPQQVVKSLDRNPRRDAGLLVSSNRAIYRYSFRQLIIFSTNLAACKLADEAFYRRIQIKVNVHSPNLERYHNIFVKMSKEIGIPFDETCFDCLFKTWYESQDRDFQAVHPRDYLRSLKLCVIIKAAPPIYPQN